MLPAERTALPALALAVALAAALTPIDVVGELVCIGTLLAFILVCVAVLVLRRTRPGQPRPFKAPGGTATPILGILACLFLMAGLPWETWARLGLWLGLGLAIYGFFRRSG